MNENNMLFKTVDYYDTFNSLNMTREFWEKYYAKLSKKEMLDLAYEMIEWPAGYPECLKGLSVAEQVEHYGVVESHSVEKSSYGDVEKTTNMRESGMPLKTYPKLSEIILKDGIVVGAVVYAVGTYKSMFPYREITTYLSIDADGTGSSTGESTAYLYCISIEEK